MYHILKSYELDDTDKVLESTATLDYARERAGELSKTTGAILLVWHRDGYEKRVRAFAEPWEAGTQWAKPCPRAKDYGHQWGCVACHQLGYVADE